MPRRKGCVGGAGGSEGRRYSKRLKLVISAQEIEAGISSTSTVEWDPFSVLPKEIYVEIFNKLDSPTDKQNFMNAHTKWYELFKAERVKFLFGKVFEDLDLTFDEEEDQDENLIGLRLVCRKWDESIQRYYQLHPDHFQFNASRDKWRVTDDSKHLLKTPYAHGYFIQWQSVPLDEEAYRNYYGGDYEGGFAYMSRKRNLGTDMDQFRMTHPPSKNPFLTRKISIEIDCRELSDVPVPEDEGLQTLWNQVETLLVTYGQHVWHFNYRGCWGLEPEMYSRILQWLRLMPELRTLQMHFGYGTGETKMFKSILRIESPELRKLQYLHVKSFSSCVFNKLLEGMKAIEKVKVTFPQQLLGFKFPKRLTEAALKLIGHEDIKYLNTLEQLPALRKLIIDLDDECSGTWSAIWMAIEEKFPALEDLHLTLPTTWSDGKEEFRYSGTPL